MIFQLVMENPGPETWTVSGGGEMAWEPTQNTSKSELVAVRSEAVDGSNLDVDKSALLNYFKASPLSTSPGDSALSMWSPTQQYADARLSSPTSYASNSPGPASTLTRWPTSASIGSQAGDVDSKGKGREEEEGEGEEPSKALTLTGTHHLSFDAYTLQFLDGYSPLGAFPAPSSEEKHQISMLSSMDIFLKTRLQEDGDPLQIVYRGEGFPTIFEDAFSKFWAVFYLLEAGKMNEAFTALDEWCEYIQDLLKTQQPPLLSLMSMMMDEFRQMGRPEIAEKVLNYLTGLAEVYFGKRHPMSVMLWCLRASNIADEVALPELAMERAVEQMGRIQHEHIAVLLEDFKFRWTHILRHRNKIEQAVLVLKDMATESEKIYGSSHIKTIEPLYVIGRTWFAAEKYLPSMVAFQEVLQRIGDIPGEDMSWQRACANGRLAQIYKRTGYDVQARTHALTLLSEAGKIWDKDHPQRKVWLARLEKESIL